MNVCVIGLGLLGGSFSLGLQKIRKDVRVIGVDANPDHAQQALSLRLAHEILPLKEAVEKSNLVVLATPVSVLLQQLPEVLEHISDDAVVIDFGSTKQLICESVKNHPKRKNFVAMHPIAGTEFSGPQAAFADLLFGKIMIVCEKEKSAPSALQLAETILKEMNMRLIYMHADEHDRHIAYVSHLSHISSFALSVTVLDKEKDEKSIFAMAGSGFSSTVRLAKSSPDMWTPIFTQNAENVSRALGAYIEKLQQFKKIIDSGDEPNVHALMEHANDIRRILEGIDKK